ncbi:MAG TPA: hypothetical protein VM716_01870 [Gemmatimonadales bacterium]|nr:hypothetical protein [Gemmatimonadales bacterium]
MTPLASGLVGEWVASRVTGSPDTTLLRFSPDGTVEQVRIRPGQKASRTPFGPFRVYADTGRTRLLCFAFRRGRASPACRYFEVDTLPGATGGGQGRLRRLRLLDWVTDKGGAPETWTERTPC